MAKSNSTLRAVPNEPEATYTPTPAEEALYNSIAKFLDLGALALAADALIEKSKNGDEDPSLIAAGSVLRTLVEKAEQFAAEADNANMQESQRLCAEHQQRKNIEASHA